MKTGLCIVLVVNLGVLASALASGNAAKPDAESLLASRARTNVTTWGEADRSAVLDEIRASANSGNHALRLKALTTLVNMGDTNAINDLIRDFDEAKPTERVRFQRELERHCTQASLIPDLVADLERDEDSKLQLVGHEFFVEPRSVVAARIIRSVMLKSDEVSESTKAWATRIDASNAQALRTEIRRWCRQNRAHILAHEFGKVLPPTVEPE